MKKLTLKIEDLNVITLETEAPAGGRGTVLGRGGWDLTKVCSSGIDYCTDNVSDCGIGTMSFDANCDASGVCGTA